ncbi:MAG TPA: FAD-dependent oxidoreductase, partial [Saprospirales bacterium]|nr:FAD-dependent oxidoreductase [Saprospirales bacterium]
MNLSYWEEKHYFEDNDLVVIGAGIVGLSTAIAAKTLRPDLKVLVLERSIVPSGASTKNAGFACFGSVTELISDSVNMKYEDQIALLKMRWDGLKLLQSNVTPEDMSYRSRGGVEVLELDDVSQITALDNINKYNEMVSDAIGL